MKKPDYRIALMVLAVVSVLAWLLIVAGAVMGILSIAGLAAEALGESMGFFFISLVLGLALAISGVLVLAATQAIRAIIDTASIAWEILERLDGRDHGLKTRRGSVRGTVSDERLVSSPDGDDESGGRSETLTDRSGRERKIIIRQDGSVSMQTVTGSKIFPSLAEAKQYIS